jgi:Transglutaminase-like superfamily
VARGLPQVPRLPDHAVRGVTVALSRRGETCLVRSVVRQHWYAAHGDPREIVIGVTSPAAGFKAHAWLAGDSQPSGERYTEISRSAAL